MPRLLAFAGSGALYQIQLGFSVALFHTIKKITQHLIQAFTIVLMVWATEQGAQLMLAHGELIKLQYFKQIIRLQAQCDLQLAQHTIIAQKMFRLRRTLIARASILNDKTVEKTRKINILAEYKLRLAFSGQPSGQFSLIALIAAELKNSNHQLITKVEDVAHAAQDIVIIDG